MSETSRLWLLSSVALTLIAAVFVLMPPLPQPLDYHDFADPRGGWGIPNFGDVMSNLSFVFAGLYGLWVVAQRKEPSHWATNARLPLWVFFGGVILVAPGSAYYHWAPDNVTLFWDRLPMTVAFMGLLAAVISDHIGTRQWVMPALIAVGAASAVYWHWTDDLRAYVLVQFLPVLIIPMILWLWPGGKWVGWKAIGGAFLFYALAKLTEHFDAEVLELLGGAVSGHSIKHLFGALSPAAVAWAIKNHS